MYSNNYKLYMHIAPNGKVYIGITGCPLLQRWHIDGSGYRNQTLFWRAIQKYGWNNFEHVVLMDNLSRDWARQLEISFINEYQSNNPKYGYNVLSGGERGRDAGLYHMPEHVRKKISESNKGKIVSADARKKISESVRHLWESDEYRSKQNRKVITDEARQNMSNSHKGYKMTDAQKEKIRQGNIGKKCTESTKRKISEVVKARHVYEKQMGIKRNCSNGGVVKGSHWCNDGTRNFRIHGEIPDGLVEGKLKSVV